MKKNTKYSYAPGQQFMVHGSRQYDFGEGHLPSVTTILSRTKDQSFLDRWRAKVGHDEAERIWANNWNSEEYARYFHGITGELVVITQNEKGAIAFDGTHLIESLGYKVSVVDPVGAGDAFTAGMLALILRQGGLKSFFELDTKACEKLLSEAIDVGNICGALTCTKRGDTAAMPTMDQVLDFKKIRKLD